jgi:hypothetical protein
MWADYEYKVLNMQSVKDSLSKKNVCSLPLFSDVLFHARLKHE